MTPFQSKKTIVFGIFGLLIVIGFFIGVNVVVNELQPTNTQTSMVIVKTKEPISLILPTIANTPSPTFHKLELKPSSTNLPTFTPIPSLTKFIHSTQVPTIPQSVITLKVPVNETNFPTQESTLQNLPFPSPQPTIIQHPTPTREPVITTTCGIIPNSVPGATNASVVFWAQFSPPQSGLAITDEILSYQGVGQRDCTAGSDSSGYASCQGSSGMLPYMDKVTVTIRTSIGDCVTYLYISKN